MGRNHCFAVLVSKLLLLTAYLKAYSAMFSEAYSDIIFRFSPTLIVKKIKILPRRHLVLQS